MTDKYAGMGGRYIKRNGKRERVECTEEAKPQKEEAAAKEKTVAKPKTSTEPKPKNAPVTGEKEA